MTGNLDLFDQDPEGRRGAAHSRPDRIQAVMSGAMKLPRDHELSKAIAALVEAATLAGGEIENGEGSGRLREGRMLVLVGNSGTGKTFSVHRAFSRHPGLAGYSRQDGASPLASFAVPSPATLRQLGNDGLAALAYESTRDLRENVVWQVLRLQLRQRGIRFLHIDELQHVLQNPNRSEHQKIRDTLKGLMQQPGWPIWIIVSGLPSIADFLQADDQIRRRCTFVRFDDLDFQRDANDVGFIVSKLCAKGGLMPEGLLKSKDDPASSHEFVHRLIHASLGRVGIAIELVQDAAVAAISAGSPSLRIEHFRAVYRARSGCPDDRNVFAAADWSTIDVRKALNLPTTGAPAETTSKHPPRIERRK